MYSNVLFRRITVVAILFTLISIPLHAQDRPMPAPEKVPAWVKNFGQQLKGQLESKDPMIQAQALQHITYFASFYKNKIDFSDSVPTLVDLYRKDDDANVRLFALVALHTIGDKNGMREVRNSLDDQRWPPRLQFVTLSALLDYYGPETFDMDTRAAAMASKVIEFYTPTPRIEVGPMEMMGFEPIEEEGSDEKQ